MGLFGLLVSAVNGFSEIILIMLFGRAICSWFVRANSNVYKIYQLLVVLTDPIVLPCKKLLDRFNTGMFDFSVMLAIFVVIIVRNLLIKILFMI